MSLLGLPCNRSLFSTVWRREAQGQGQQYWFLLRFLSDQRRVLPDTRALSVIAAGDRCFRGHTRLVRARLLHKAVPRGDAHRKSCVWNNAAFAHVSVLFTTGSTLAALASASVRTSRVGHRPVRGRRSWASPSTGTTVSSSPPSSPLQSGLNDSFLMAAPDTQFYTKWKQ